MALEGWVASLAEDMAEEVARPRIGASGMLWGDETPWKRTSLQFSVLSTPYIELLTSCSSRGA